MDPKSQIIKSLSEVTGQKDIHFEIPEREEFGDYSTNVAMVLFSQEISKERNRNDSFLHNPQPISEKIVNNLKKDRELMKVVDKINTAGPGFINFYLNNDVLLNNLMQIDATSEDYGKSNLLEDKKICVEYTDPNPFKEFHIGHLISNVTGESISRIFEANNATVWRADYFGDVGIHAAKSVWGIMKKFNADGINLEILAKKDLKDRISYMGEGYAMGSKSYDEDDKAKEEIGRLNTILYIAAQKMWEKEGKKAVINYDSEGLIKKAEISEIYDLYVTGRKWSLEYFETIYKRLGTKFDGYYPESVVGEVGCRLVKKNIGKVFKESEGAVIFEGEKFGLHTRVFINNHNLPTYEGKELGLAPSKYNDFQYDRSVIVVGHEIKEYFAVLVEALKQVEPKLGEITFPVFTGMVTVPGVRWEAGSET